ncbi:hypothetical protein F4820DRAFT_463709 [Hypoxylon rubiginosum]|uniref:Uncharacterized protein n=1 Tax=Hypoxylon rubiginosum TaxID=110542 RepID=A0ACB9YSW9_9PEZI|nr:hypothetical protein F4820DRAFT_463709 [Hypoxylon rubiginosum]
MWESCSWKWEIASCVLVLASPLGILATLYPYDGRPLPQLPFKVLVNAILSILSMVLKASLAFLVASCLGQLQWTWFSQGRPIHDLVLYDNARQGPWGSLLLLWTQRFRQPLATLGAVLFILSMGIDPSIQQPIGYYDCSVVINASDALLPRTNMFHDQLDNPTFGRDMESAFSRGIAQLGNGLFPKCITGNCSFTNPYSTLGYYSFCEDSSDEITIDTTYSPDDFPSADFGRSRMMRSITFKSGLPRGVYVMTDIMGYSQLNVTHSVNISTLDTATSAPDIEYKNGAEVAKIDIFYSDYDDFQQPERPERITVKILAGKTVYSDRHIDISTGEAIPGCGNGTSVDSWRCRGYGAATCTIQPCVRVYNATVAAGHLTERLLAHSGNVVWGKDPIGNSGLGIIDTDCLTPQNKRNLADQGYVINETSRWLPYGAISDPEADLLLAQKCLYFMDTGFVSSSGVSIISSYFMGTLTGGGGECGLNGYSLSSFDGSEILKHIHDFGRIDFNRIQETFLNISESLTTYIRINGDENYSEPAVGEISFPSSLAALTILFFIMTASSKTLGRFPAWKASPLPWLICMGLEAQDS